MTYANEKEMPRAAPKPDLYKNKLIPTLKGTLFEARFTCFCGWPCA